MLAYANAKVSVSEAGVAGVIAESRPQDDGRSQFLLADNLRPGTSYVLHYEFSAREADLDGQGALACETFILELQSFATEDACKDDSAAARSAGSSYPVYTNPGEDGATTQIRFTKSEHGSWRKE